MGKPVTSNVKRVEITALNTKVNKEVFSNFKDSCSYLGYSMNVVLETFMRQYTNGRFHIEHNDIIKWKKDETEVDTLNTTFNKEIYVNFKSCCKGNGYFVKHVITSFMEKFSSGNYIMEYINLNEINKG